MTEVRVFSQYNNVLSKIFHLPAKQKLATKEYRAVIVFKYLIIVL